MSVLLFPSSHARDCSGLHGQIVRAEHQDNYTVHCSWNPALTTFLNQLSGHLARRTCREAELAAKSAADAADAAG